MKNNNLSDQVIDNFILGLLSDDENQKFHFDLETNVELAEQVKLRQEMIFGLEAYGRKSLKTELKDIHNEVIGERKTKTPVKRRSIFPYVAAAASVLILIIAFTWFLGNNRAINTKDLYAANFEQYDISGMQRSKGNEEVLRLEQLYKNERYSEVLPLLESQLALDIPKPSHLLLATGITYLELDDPKKALSYFKQVTAKKDFNFEDEVHWYSALAYLKSDDLESTKKELQPLIQDTKADHHLAARKLLKAISN